MDNPYNLPPEMLARVERLVEKIEDLPDAPLSALSFIIGRLADATRTGTPEDVDPIELMRELNELTALFESVDEDDPCEE